MAPPRGDSIAGSAVDHGLENLNLKDGDMNADNEQDDLLQTPSLEAGVFGVLFTLSQEKNEQHIHYHWILLKILLDAWQLYTTVLNPELGWDIDINSTAWQIVSVLSFRWLNQLGYNWYVGVLYGMAGLLAVNLALCVWVAWSFKEQKFDYVWPIKVVRGFSYVFLQVFDITSLNFLQLGISCNFFGPVTPHLHMMLFPAYSCSSTPHIVSAIVSGLLLVIFVAVAMLVNMSEVEVNPASKSPQGLGHSGAEVTAFGIKALLTLVGVFLGYPKVAAVAYLLLTFWLAWEYLRWVPHLLIWVNCLKGGVAVTMVSVSSLQLAVALMKGTAAGDRTRSTITFVMVLSLGPVFLAGAAIAWLRTKLFTAAVIRAFRTTDPKAVKPQDVYHFAHPRDVEVAARCARKWTDLYTLEKTAVHIAEEIIKGGVALFPEDAFVSLVHANFMLDMLGFSQTGSRHLEAVRKLKPSIMCRFMLFVRQQEATQKAASSTVGRGGNMDLLGYVEYQRKQRMVLRHHKDALQAMANFWRILGASSTISFSSLSKSLEDIDSSVSQAETAYRVVMELYNNSPRLVRLYARFLETIKQDPWTAAQYHATADRLEENKDEDGQGPTLPDGTPIGRMDDVDKGVLVVNAFGDIQVANRKLHDMFGYKKGELDGKNVTLLMPPHEAKRHPAILRHYIDSGDQAPPYFKHPVLGIHRERVAFTIRIAVSRASGLGEDSVFIGIMEALPSDPGVGRLWVTPEGLIVCCDPGFATCFGYHPEDVIGAQLDKLLRTGGCDMDRAASSDVWMASKVKHDNQELVQRMLESSQEYGASTAPGRSPPKPFTCSVLHKYDFAKEVTVSVRSDAARSSMYEIRMKLATDEPQLLMVVERKGAIRHMSGDLAKILGVGVTDGPLGGHGPAQGGGGGGEASDYVASAQVMVDLQSEGAARTLDDFMPMPWKTMHYKYRKYVTGGSPMLAGAWGCRALLTDSSKGPTMQLVGLHGKPVYVHVAVSSREEAGELTHVVRMGRSCLETAIAERRIRVRVSEDGLVQELHQGATAASAENTSKHVAELFGFPAEQLVGCKLWDFLSTEGQHNNGRRNLMEQRDVLAEAEALVDGGPSRSVSESKKHGIPGLRAATTELDLRTFDSMITSTLQTPGISWRVKIVPPSAMVEAAAMGNPTRAAAVLSRRSRNAIIRLDVATASSSKEHTIEPGHLLVHMELWIADAVTGVLEVDAVGRVTKVLEGDTRPPGLLFGLPREDIVGSQLGTLLRLGPGQSAAGLLTESGIAKKSSLKTSSRKGKVVEKVGPVHYLEGFHRDNQRLSLAVQVVGKPGPGNPVIAVVRLAPISGPGAQKKQTGAATAMSGGGGLKPHVSLSYSGLPSDMPGVSMQQPGPLQLQLRGPSFARGHDLMAAGTMRKSGDNGASLLHPADGLAGASQTALLPVASAASLRLAPSMSRASRAAVAVDGPMLPGSPTQTPEVACVIAARPGGLAAAQGARVSSPLKPSTAEASNDLISGLRAEAALGNEGAGDPNGDSRELALEKAILALGASARGDMEAEGVDKWVTSGGDYYKNRSQSLDGMSRADGDFDDEDDGDEQGSFGAASRATSSRWASPTESRAQTQAFDEQPQHHHHGGLLAPPPHGAGAWGGGPDDPHARRSGEMPPAGGPHGANTGPAGPAPDDHPDDRSDGGESAISGYSGASGLSDGDSPADFQRGKRYRKLIKLMDSPEAQKAVVRLRVNTVLAMAAAGAVHVVCFAFIITAVGRQSHALDQLASAGGAQRYLQKALVSVRALDQAYKGKGSSNTYGPANAEAFANDLMTYSLLYRNVNGDLLQNSASALESLYYVQKIEVWSGVNATTSVPYDEMITLWDMVTRSFVSAKSIFQNHVEWHRQGLNISSMLPAEFLLYSGESLIRGMREVLDALLDAAVARTNTVNLLQLTFLILEGCVVSFCCAVVMVYILRSACDKRYQLYETFLKIPVGLTRALASQTTHLLDDDESEDEEDDDGIGSQSKDHADNGHDGQTLSPVKRKAGFDEASASDRNGHPHGGDPKSPMGHKAPMGLKSPMGHKQLGDSVGAMLAAGVVQATQGARARRRSSMVLLDHYELPPSAYVQQQPSSGAQQGWLARVKGKLWRSGTVRPAAPSPTTSAERRTLERNSTVATSMLAFVTIYSILIIIFYSIAYAILINVKDMVALQGVADHNLERTYRTVFYSQELVAEENVTAMPSRLESVRGAAIALRDAYYTLRMGAYAWTAVGPDIEKFPLVVGHGLVKESKAMFNLFYASDTCLRLKEHLPCPPRDYRFYEVTRTGVDGMLIQLLTELKYLADEAEAAAESGGPQPGPASDHWDYIYNVGTKDLDDAIGLISSQHMYGVKNVFKAVVVMHVALFLLLIGVLACFLMAVYLPLLRNMNKEKRRIAEMMSQLPAELDVMRLVSTALMGPKASGHHHRHGGTRGAGSMDLLGSSAMLDEDSGPLMLGNAPAVAAGNVSMSKKDGDAGTGGKAYQAWKDILNRSTAVNPATQGSGGVPGGQSKRTSAVFDRA